MKKIIKYWFTICGIFFLSITQVHAATSYVASITGVNEIEQGKVITFTINVSGLNEIGDGITVFMADVNYDSSKLEPAGASTSVSGFTATWGTRIVLDGSTGIKSGRAIATLKFNVKASAAIGSTTITLNNIVSSINGGNVSATSTSKTFNIRTPKSTNNYLSGITINDTKIANFNKSTLTYTLATVNNDKTSIKIGATAEDSKSSISGVGTKSLAVGNNAFKVVVKSESGSTRTYTINIKRLAKPGSEVEKKETTEKKEETNVPTGTEETEVIPPIINDQENKPENPKKTTEKKEVVKEKKPNIFSSNTAQVVIGVVIIECVLFIIKRLFRKKKTKQIDIPKPIQATPELLSIPIEKVGDVSTSFPQSTPPSNQNTPDSK